MDRALAAETLAAQAMGDIDPVYGALVPPIHPSTVYEFGPDGAYRSRVPLSADVAATRREPLRRRRPVP